MPSSDRSRASERERRLTAFSEAPESRDGPAGEAEEMRAVIESARGELSMLRGMIDAGRRARGEPPGPDPMGALLRLGSVEMPASQREAFREVMRIARRDLRGILGGSGAEPEAGEDETLPPPGDRRTRPRETRERTPVRTEVDRIRQDTRGDLGPLLNGRLSQLCDRARRACRESPRSYHESLRYSPRDAQGRPVREEPGRHFFEAHLAPNTRPKPLIVMIMGNRDSLTDPDPQTKRRGLSSTFSTIAQRHPEDFDVLKIRLGNVLSRDGNQHNELAFLHAQNVVHDALRGRGIFEGRQYTSVTFAGFSYGAGAIDRMLSSWPGDIRVPVNGTAYIDAIRFRSAAAALTTRPGRSQRHLHLYQRRITARRPIRGAPIPAGSMRPGDAQREISVPDHGALHNLNTSPAIRDLYEREMVEYLTSTARGGPPRT